jgi:hypothetical protein
MRPQSIHRFDRLYFLSVALGLANFALNFQVKLAEIEIQRPRMGAGGALVFMFAVLGVTLVISLLIWWLVSRRASNTVRWLLTVFAVIGVISAPLSLVSEPPLAVAMTAIIAAVQATAVWFLFRPNAAAWFKHDPRGMDPDVFE